MAGLMRREPGGEVGEFFSHFDRMFEQWARMMPFRTVPFARWPDVGGMIHIEEFHDAAGARPASYLRLTAGGGP
jgi:hypothetical protein